MKFTLIFFGRVLIIQEPHLYYTLIHLELFRKK